MTLVRNDLIVGRVTTRREAVFFRDCLPFLTGRRRPRPKGVLTDQMFNVLLYTHIICACHEKGERSLFISRRVGVLFKEERGTQKKGENDVPAGVESTVDK